MKKHILLIPLTLSLFIFLFSLYYKSNIHCFDSNTVLDNIKVLSSHKYKGRLAGTLENDEATFYLKEYIKNEKLKPFNGNYYDGFTANIPCKTSGSPYLLVKDEEGNVIKQFEYGLDYKEDLLNFKETTLSFNYKDEHILKDNIIQIKKGKNYFIFYVPDENSLNFRSSFMQDSFHSMYIMITENTYNEIKNYIINGYYINCFIPYEIKNTKINNIAGFIEGKDTKASPIIISAHFDHIGSDLNNNVFPGALDNASGVSFIMEMEKYLKSLGKPDVNILFVFFNGEDLGLLGSRNFAGKYKDSFKKSIVFNFDMIGSSNAPLGIMAGSMDSEKTSLVKDVSNVCLLNHIEYTNLYEDSSDHEAFRKYGIEAITFCDDDISKIHTPLDMYEFIDSKAIKRCFDVSSKEIVKASFNNKLLIYHHNLIICVSLISFLLFSFVYYIFVKTY